MYLQAYYYKLLYIYIYIYVYSLLVICLSRNSVNPHHWLLFEKRNSRFLLDGQPCMQSGALKAKTEANINCLQRVTKRTQAAGAVTSQLASVHFSRRPQDCFLFQNTCSKHFLFPLILTAIFRIHTEMQTDFVQVSVNTVRL